MSAGRLRILTIVTLLVGIGAAVALATPEPSAIPVAWELKLDPTQPMRIQVDTGGGKKTFWYMLYTVRNETGEDIDFHPEIVRVNEMDSEVPADRISENPAAAPKVTVDPAIIGLDSRIFKAIAQRHAKTHPFLVTPVEAIGRLLQGRDNARTSVAVFHELDPRVNKFTIYFGGLSGERITRPNPAYEARTSSGDQMNGHGAGDEANPKLFVLRKTLAIPYTLPGDLRTRVNATPVLGRMTWVMR